MPVSKSTLKRILKEVGAQRVSDEGVREFASQVNDFAYALAKKAVQLAAHAKRKTVEKSDVELAK